MCCSYFLENSTKLAGIAHAASKHRIKGRMLEKLGQPLITEGEVLPGRIAPVIAPDRRGESRVFPMVWGFTGKASLVTCAKIEAIEKSNLFSEAFMRHRCIVPASWYFEREHLMPVICSELAENQTADNRKVKAAPSATESSCVSLGDRYLLQAKGSAVTFLAGMYRIEEADGMKIPHFILLTKEAPKDIHFIHNRMPLVLDINDSNMINGWINPGSGPWILERIIRNTVTDMVFEKRNVG